MLLYQPDLVYYECLILLISYGGTIIPIDFLDSIESYIAVDIIYNLYFNLILFSISNFIVPPNYLKLFVLNKKKPLISFVSQIIIAFFMFPIQATIILD